AAALGKLVRYGLSRAAEGSLPSRIREILAEDPVDRRPCSVSILAILKRPDPLGAPDWLLSLAPIAGFTSSAYYSLLGAPGWRVTRPRVAETGTQTPRASLGRSRNEYCGRRLEHLSDPITGASCWSSEVRWGGMSRHPGSMIARARLG